MNFQFTPTNARRESETAVYFTYSIDGVQGKYGSDHDIGYVYVRGSFQERLRSHNPYITMENLVPALTKWAKKKARDVNLIDPTLIGKTITITVTR